MAAAAETADLVGLGWRGELAAGIFANLAALDLVEVIADDYFRASRSKMRELRTLGSYLPVTLHGVGMGLASTVPVSRSRIDAMARLVEVAQPRAWSEHLAFVRGQVEIGHLAAPPRSRASLDGALVNFARVTEAVGMAPAMENIATLLQPPASTMTETAWISAFTAESGANLLLDLHNLYANAVNFGADPFALLDELPLAAVTSVHLSGGHWITTRPDAAGRTRTLIDDHVHDVPAVVYELLEALASKAAHPLTVVIERDGAYPPIAHLLQQVGRAREALAAGRKRRSSFELATPRSFSSASLR